MKAALDSSILVSALWAADPDHAACRRVLLSGRHIVWSHALTETFSTLTGGRLGFRVPTGDAARLLRQQVVPKIRLAGLDPEKLLAAQEDAEARGVRGGAIYDYLHLVAARIAGAKRFYTLNIGDFRSFHRDGDPDILLP